MVEPLPRDRWSSALANARSNTGQDHRAGIPMGNKYPQSHHHLTVSVKLKDFDLLELKLEIM